MPVDDDDAASPKVHFARELEQTLHNALGEAAKRWHEYATLEHLLIALIDDAEASEVLKACNVDRAALRNQVREYLDKELSALDVRLAPPDEERGGRKPPEAVDPTPTSGFQRVVQRAILHVKGAGRDEVNGANVLVALFTERESYAVHFLTLQGITRADAVTYLIDAGHMPRTAPPQTDRGVSEAAREKINRVFRDDLRAVADVVSLEPVLTTPRAATKITELAIDLVEQSGIARNDGTQGARPLVTLGLYGPWGSGKSTLLRRIGSEMSNSGFVTVFINTWKWDGDEDIYSFMNRELLRSLSKTKGLRWRAVSLQFMLSTRANIHRWSAWIVFLIAAGIGVFLIDWTALDPQQIAKGTIAAATVTGLIAMLSKPAASLIERLLLSEPADIDARQSLSKSYRYLDFMRRLARRKNRSSVAFLFDDLDRCDDKKAVDFVRSIHSLTSDGSVCIVACDEEFAAAAIYSQYKSVADYLEEGKEFGKRFLEKIIHVPFRLPEISAEDLRSIGLMPPVSVDRSSAATQAPLTESPSENPAEAPVQDLKGADEGAVVSEARLWEIAGGLLATVVEPCGLQIRQAKMLSNVIKLYSMIFPPKDEESAQRMAAFLIVTYIDPCWIPREYFGVDDLRSDSPLDSVDTQLREKLGEDPATLITLYKLFGLRSTRAARMWNEAPARS